MHLPQPQRQRGLDRIFLLGTLLVVFGAVALPIWLLSLLIVIWGDAFSVSAVGSIDPGNATRVRRSSIQEMFPPWKRGLEYSPMANEKRVPEQPEGVLVAAAKSIGAAAGRIAAAVGITTPEKPKAPKMVNKNKSRLPRRQKKAAKTIAPRAKGTGRAKTAARRMDV